MVHREEQRRGDSNPCLIAYLATWLHSTAVHVRSVAEYVGGTRTLSHSPETYALLDALQCCSVATIPAAGAWGWITSLFLASMNTAVDPEGATTFNVLIQSGEVH